MIKYLIYPIIKCSLDQVPLGLWIKTNANLGFQTVKCLFNNRFGLREKKNDYIHLDPIIVVTFDEVFNTFFKQERICESKKKFINFGQLFLR